MENSNEVFNTAKDIVGNVNYAGVEKVFSIGFSLFMIIFLGIYFYNMYKGFVGDAEHAITFKNKDKNKKEKSISKEIENEKLCRCSKCGTLNDLDSKFCKNCGNTMN